MNGILQETSHYAPRCGGTSDRRSPISAHWRDVELDEIPAVPGMTQPDELRYFFWCCAAKHQPGRRAVELGPWMGRSTVALAAGLRRSADSSGKLVTIDRFRWDEWALNNALEATLASLTPEQRAGLSFADLHPQENDSFLPIFRVGTEPLKESIDVIEADIESYQWSGEPIDVLMIDAAKSWATFDQIVREFFPCLTDQAVVIHQDYKHYYCYWIHIVTERMLDRGVLSWAENVDGLPTQGFRFHKTHSFQVDDFLESAFTLAEADRLFRQCLQRPHDCYGRMTIVGAYDQFLKTHHRHADAQRNFRNAIRGGGFADNYGLHDLLRYNAAWFRSLVADLLAGMGASSRSGGVSAALRLCGEQSIAFDAPGNGMSLTIEAGGLPTADAAEMVLNFFTDWSSSDSVRLRVTAAPAANTTAFYDEEFVLSPGHFQPVVIPVENYAAVALRWTASTIGAGTASRQVQCIAPLLLC